MLLLMSDKKLPLTQLTALSPLDGRYREHVRALSVFYSEYGFIKTRLEIEIQFLLELSEWKVIRPFKPKEKQLLTSLIETANEEHILRIKEIEKSTRHDIKAIERFLRERMEKTPLEDIVEMIHFGLTSEDVNNLSHRLLLKRVKEQILLPTLREVSESLSLRSRTYKSIVMLARTHGQPAVPTTLGKEFVNFAVRLSKQIQALEKATLTGKLNGAVGNFNALTYALPGIDWISFSENFTKHFGLEPNNFTTQINPYEDIIEHFQIIERINGILLDFNQDMWRYISDEWLIQEIKKGEVGSSTMPQKVNPIFFENSEGNLQIANSLFEGMVRKLGISRLQRDLSDSTTMRNVGISLGYSVLAYKNALEGLKRISPNEKKIKEDLNKNWTILTEGVQTLLRKNNIKDPYLLISGLSKGQNIGEKEWTEWVEQLPIDKKLKTRIQTLTPETYIGYAEKLVESAIKDINKVFHR